MSVSSLGENSLPQHASVSGVRYILIPKHLDIVVTLRQHFLPGLGPRMTRSLSEVGVGSRKIVFDGRTKVLRGFLAIHSLVLQMLRVTHRP